MRARLPFAPRLSLLLPFVVLGTAPSSVRAGASFVEDFSTTAGRDAGATTADWNTAAGELRLFPFVASPAGSAALGGTAYDVACAAGHAYVASGSAGLKIVDTGTAAVTGTLGGIPTARAVALHGRLALLAADVGGLLIADVSDPAAPSLVGSLATSGRAYGVAVAGDLAAVADVISGFHLIDISNPAAPAALANLPTTDNAYGVDLAGDHAYVADGDGGILVFDISDPALPALVGSASLPGHHAWDVHVDGNHAFVAVDARGLQVLDVSDPTAPALVTVHDVASRVYDVRVDGDLAFLACDGAGLKVLDVSDPASPAILLELDTGGTARAAFPWDGVGWVADGSAGLAGFTVSTLAPPTPLAIAGPLTLHYDNAVSGNHLYIAAYSYGLLVTDVSDPAAPQSLGLNAPTPAAIGVDVAGDLAFVADVTDGLLVFDVTDPAVPAPIGSLDLGGASTGPSDVRVAGDHAYLTGTHNGGLWIVDVSDPSAPVLTDHAATVYEAEELFVSGDHAYLAAGTDGLVILDVSDPTNAFVTAVLNTPGEADGVWVDGGWAYVADKLEGLQVVDVSDPAAPSIVGWNIAVGSARSVAAEGDRVFVADQIGLKVFDVSDRTTPVLVESADSPGVANGLTLAGDFAYLTGLLQGSTVYQVRQRDVDRQADFARSLYFGVDGSEILRVRALPEETGAIGWEVGSSSSGSWVDAPTDGTWAELPSPVTSLRWRATLDWAPEGTAADEVRVEWLNHFARIDSVRDIAGDQGGQVRVAWTRSGHDFVGDPQQITQYAVYRRIDGVAAAPAGPVPAALREHAGRMAGAGWDFVATVPVRTEDAYSVVVPTLADSSVAGGQHWSVFRVSALTATPGVFWDSPPDSGYSVDNLAPGAPGNLLLAGAALSWDAAPEPDFQYHAVYGSASPALDPSATLLGYSIDVGFDVSGLPFPYYHVTATDQAGNEGDAASIAGGATASPEPSGAPGRLSLSPPRPNPSWRTAAFVFELPTEGRVSLAVYDAAGRRVRTLIRGIRSAGQHEARWDGRDDAGRPTGAGVYFVRLGTGSDRETRRVVRLR